MAKAKKKKPERDVLYLRLPPPLLTALKGRAHANLRSANAEAQLIVEAALASVHAPVAVVRGPQMEMPLKPAKKKPAKKGAKRG